MSTLGVPLSTEFDRLGMAGAEGGGRRHDGARRLGCCARGPGCVEDQRDACRRCCGSAVGSRHCTPPCGGTTAVMTRAATSSSRGQITLAFGALWIAAKMAIRQGVHVDVLDQHVGVPGWKSQFTYNVPGVSASGSLDGAAVRRCAGAGRLAYRSRVPRLGWPAGRLPAARLDCHGPLWTGIIAWPETWYIADCEAPKKPVFVAVLADLI